MTKYKVLEKLQECPGVYCSGEELSTELGLSRTAIWKAIKALREEGYQIHAVTNKGYQLLSQDKVLSEYELKKRLRTRLIGHSIQVFDSLSSTNDYAKTIAGDEDKNGHVVIADSQTSGRAKADNSFYSPESTGIYISAILKPPLTFDQLGELRYRTVDSMVQAVLKLSGVQISLRAPNELICFNRKIGGVLMEASVETESGQVEYVVTGMGLYVNDNDFPAPWRDKLVSIKQIVGHEVDRMDLVACYLNHLDASYNEFCEKVL